MPEQIKKKNPVVLFLLAFVVIVVLTFIAKHRSKLKHELSGPKGGVEKLSTYQGKLIAISIGNEVYTWDWNDLSGRPSISSVNAQRIVAMALDRLLWMPRSSTDALIVSNLKGDKELNRLFLMAGTKCTQLQASSNGQYAVAILESDEGSGKQIRLAVIKPDASSIKLVEMENFKEGFKLNGIAISNDGASVAAAGKAKKGLFSVVGVSDNQLIWRYDVEDCNELNKIAFSPDGKMVYATESGRRVYIFNIASGKLVRMLEMDEYKTPPNNPQTISCITVSADGGLLAAASSPFSKIWIWDVKDGKEIDTISTGHFSTSSISFSPDSSLLAGADLTDKPIKVWKVPAKH